jgi:hypothetical protein
VGGVATIGDDQMSTNALGMAEKEMPQHRRRVTRVMTSQQRVRAATRTLPGARPFTPTQRPLLIIHRALHHIHPSSRPCDLICTLSSPPHVARHAGNRHSNCLPWGGGRLGAARRQIRRSPARQQTLASPRRRSAAHAPTPRCACVRACVRACRVTCGGAGVHGSSQGSCMVCWCAMHE